MPDEVEPSPTPLTVPDAEPLLRRYLPAPGSTVVPVAAFRPTGNDTDGLSVSLQSLPQPLERVLADTRRPATDYSVCVFDLHELSELSAVLSPTDADPGHATIPQICPPYDKLKESDERKILLRGWMVELARRAQTIHNAGDPIEPTS